MVAQLLRQPRCFLVNHLCLFRRSVSSDWSTGSGVRARFNTWGFQTLYVEGNAGKYWRCQNVLIPHYFLPTCFDYNNEVCLVFGSLKKKWILAHL